MIRRWLLLVVLAVWGALPMSAQQSIAVTDDDVNAIANRLYCPVCPNETLDACRTEACAQWRAEIRVLLESGATESQVIDSFIDRFGQRVIGSPTDPGLQALAVGAPILIGGVAAAWGILTFTRWAGKRRVLASAPQTPPAADADADYRAVIERDIQ
ncbi:MAG: cytochrome c-type biogenesis protein CcmH [bacterium]|nr:cytochrome c-type biogenesis protein CcmH [bacterium]